MKLSFQNKISFKERIIVNKATDDVSPLCLELPQITASQKSTIQGDERAKTRQELSFTPQVIFIQPPLNAEGARHDLSKYNTKLAPNFFYNRYKDNNLTI